MPTTLHLSLAEYDSMALVGAFDRLERKVEKGDSSTRQLLKSGKILAPQILPDAKLNLHDLFN